MNGQPPAPPSIVSGYGYFLLRLRLAPPTHPPAFSGVIERLGSGEQRLFENVDDLLRLLGAGPEGSTMLIASTTPDVARSQGGTSS